MKAPLFDAARYAAYPGSVIQRVDDGLIVADKPAGLPSTGHTLEDPDCLQALLIARLRRTRIWAVHQLDRGTSGLNLFVTRKALVQVWQDHLRRGSKRYLAVVEGAPAEPGASRRIDARIRGKEAVTVVRALGRSAGLSLIEARIETGRTHQIRLHLAGIGHPLVGEQQHREPPDLRHPRPLLHAWRIELEEDAPEAVRTLEAPLPLAFRAACRRFGLPESPPQVPA